MNNKKSVKKRVIILTLVVILSFFAMYMFSSQVKTEGIGQFNDLDLGSNTHSYAIAVRKSAPAVVSIQTTKSGTSYQSLGSGVIVDKKGHILTNNHVIEATKEIQVMLADGRRATASIIGADPDTDLAVLKIELANLPVINFGSSSKLQVGDIVLAIGNPLGLNTSVTQGIVSAIGSFKNISNAPQEFGELLDKIIQTDAAINLGNSGGALTDATGKLVGINTALIANLVGGNGIGFAIPIDPAKAIMKELIANGKITRAWLGAQLSELPYETKLKLDYQEPNGIYVQDTIRNSPARKAGILPGDIITKINNVKTEDILSTIRLISSLAPEKSYDLEVFRQGQIAVLPVTMIERP
jgi:serine protease DegQ